MYIYKQNLRAFRVAGLNSCPFRQYANYISVYVYTLTVFHL